LPGGVVRLLPGYEVAWGSAVLSKRATLDLSLAGASPPAGTLALYASMDGTTWQRVGGTVEAGTARISAPLSEAGRYALFAEPRPPIGTGTLSGLSLTPRVFSPQGNYASRELAIAFTLGRAAAVEVDVFNRAGRLVRRVAVGLALTGGANLVRWDGRDAEGAIVSGGIYIVSVRALGETQTRTVAVTR